MNDRPAPAEQITLEYLNALDAGDLDAIARMWERATTDPVLAQALTEATEEAAREVEDELGPAPARDRVLTLLREQMPSAFPATPESPRPVTLGEVAARLKAGTDLRGLSPADVAANEALLVNATPLPDDLGMPQWQRWSAQLPVLASPRYWKLFRKAALLLNMSRCQADTQLAAARQARPPEKPA